MSRPSWNLLTLRQTFTRLPSNVLARYYCCGYPEVSEGDRPYHHYSTYFCNDDCWNWLINWLSGDPTLRTKIERYKQALLGRAGGRREEAGAQSKSRRIGGKQLFVVNAALSAYLASPTAGSKRMVAVTPVWRDRCR